MDVSPSCQSVIQCDLSQGIPLPDNHCAVIYHAAVLEHFRLNDARRLLRDCLRVMAPDGIIRVGVPDLEQLCRLYLQRLEKAVTGDRQAVHDYDWLMLELFDQIVRETSGGAMIKWLQSDALPNEAFVFQRIGEEARALVWERGGQEPCRRVSNHSLLRLRRALGDCVHVFKRSLKHCMEYITLTRRDRLALAIGRFRLGGEVHQWMYDRFSLARLLQEAGFVNPTICSARHSQIPDWSCFHLDTLPDGTTIKPDLLFMEARKPIGPNHAF